MPNPVMNRFLVINDEEEIPSILNPVTGKVYIINSVGLEILRLCDGTRSIAEIVNKLFDEYDSVSREQLQSDVMSFIEDCSKGGVIDWK